MKQIFHSIKLIEEKCKGCTKCMTKCPVEAIRLKNQKALIYTEKCIDCGECIRVCPYNAHVAEKDELDKINEFKMRIAVPSITLYSQFGKFISPVLINNAIKNLGFDDVFDTTYACDIVSEITKKEISKIKKPAISLVCPTVSRIVHVNYPNLVEHSVKVLTPIEVSASLIREKYNNQGFKDEDIGIFYLTPCAGWITKVKQTANDIKSTINGAIAINDIYTKLLKYINKNVGTKYEGSATISSTGLLWALSGGQSKSMDLIEYISVDGVENVIKVLDEVEKGKFDNVEYIDALACDGGCLGGILLVDNTYNAKRVLRKYFRCFNFTYKLEEMNEEYKEKFTGNISSIKTYSQKLADDFESAVKKMKYMNRLINTLPGIDCGQCGSPSCKAFAEDVARGLSSIKDCKVIEIGGEFDESK